MSPTKCSRSGTGLQLHPPRVLEAGEHRSLPQAHCVSIHGSAMGQLCRNGAFYSAAFIRPGSFRTLLVSPGRRHSAGSSTPARHFVTPNRMYPALQTGRHVEPLGRLEVQSPAAPFSGAADASQGSGIHEACVMTPRWHDVDPVPWYPSSHCGSHVCPLCSVDEQLPISA